MLPSDLPFIDHSPFPHTLADLVARFDWSSTSLGDMASWPQSQRAIVAFALRSPLGIAIMFGADGVMIYNDAYAAIAGDRHPRMLGMKVTDVWPEAAEFNAHVVATGLAGKTFSYADQEFALTRNGSTQQAWFNLDYSPVFGDDGTPIGVIGIVAETTSKVRAERYLAGETARMKSMFAQAPGFMTLLTGPQHIFTLANEAYFELIGHRDIIGQTVAEGLPEAAAQGFVGLLDDLYRSGETFSGNAILFKAEATDTSPARERYLDFVYQPVRNDNNEIFGIFVQGSDVTDRVLAELAARESDNTFRTLAQALPNQVWASAADGVLDWFNERVYAYSGATPGDLDHGGWASMVHEEDIGAAAQAWEAANKSGDGYEMEFRLRRADGAYRWHIARALPIKDEHGAVQRWVGTNTDIEDQKLAAKVMSNMNAILALEVSRRTAERDRMWLLSSDLMLVADLDANITAVNPAFTTLLGWRESEVVGTSFIDLVHPDDVQATLAEVATLGEGKNTFKFENRYRHHDGSYRILAWSASPDEGFIHAVGRDVTSEREAAEAMRRTEHALQQSQKMETIGKLTGGVAHDFNNLLQVISGNLQLLLSDVESNPRALRRVENAIGGVMRGAKLASQLLAFGRRQALEPRVVKISRYVAGMDDMLHRTIGEEIELETVISAGLWNVLADTAQVENAVLNLCINARDAMGGVGRLTIEVCNATLDDAYASNHVDVVPGQYVMIAVSDTGSGMTPEVLQQACEPFFSTKPEGKGTGLGLSMVYGFVKQSGGHIKIYSEVGSGTSVKLYLPRSHEAEDATALATVRPITGGSETILVAEDDDDVRETVVELLGEMGYRVLKANDAASALAIISSGMPIDLLFTDVVMPGPLRSPELARKARELLPQLAVLFTSGYTENAIVHGGRLDAGVELLGKPYTRAALAQKIRHVLANQKQRVEAETAARALDAAAPRTPAGSALKIVLVEDDEALRTITTEILEHFGHSVSQAGDAESALALPALRSADVLITDLTLPGMSGEALAQRARSLAPDLGIVLASGRSSESDVKNAVHLLKPFDMDALSVALQKVLLR
ncbi:PAS domain S-box protein [Massilia sp. R2A-15]|uniref:hybrid sensor histidine kinase/response regulator n=1 Tax=Massilia sp. R2A-15 TaxID=3064278 RepID=UPI0027322D80|nr:PAS domain S-box protein [Massilia sp. R2A-15]WLI88131.1 PAS domain S-box protein [Massilia sp. R2A-15]